MNDSKNITDDKNKSINLPSNWSVFNHLIEIQGEIYGSEESQNESAFKPSKRF